MTVRKKLKTKSKKTAIVKRKTVRRKVVAARAALTVKPKTVKPTKIFKSLSMGRPRTKKVSKSALTYTQKLKIVKRYDEIKIKEKKTFTAKDKRAISRAYKAVAPLATKRTIFKKVGVKARAKAKAEGHKVTKKGVFITLPVDGKGQPIKGVRVTFDKNGVTTIKKGKRVQFEVGFTKGEVIQIVSDVRHIDDVIKSKLDKNKELARKFKRAEQKTIKLVFGQYLGGETIQGINQLNVYLNAMNPKSREHLTGLRFVFHESGGGKKSVKKKKGRNA